MGIKDYIKMFFDWDTARGTIGSAMTVILPFIKALTPVLQFLGAICGLVLVLYSIYHKRLQIKNEKNGNSKPSS